MPVAINNATNAARPQSVPRAVTGQVYDARDDNSSDGEPETLHRCERRRRLRSPGSRSLAEGDEAELRRIHATPQVMPLVGRAPRDFPWDEPESTRLTILVDGAVAGLIQFWEETEPKYRHAGIDCSLTRSSMAGGSAPRCCARIVRHLIDDLGHHRVTIDPAADNAAAIRSYEKAGFRRVGVMRAYERDVGGEGWHDGLLMELTADG